MLFNKKSMLTLFAGVALLSASSINGINASANDNPAPKKNGPSDNTVGSIDNEGKASGKLGTADNQSNPHTVSGKSDAHIKVVHGYLVLESVPSLGFQDVAQSDSHDNTSTRVTDNDTVLKSDTYFNQQNNKPAELSVLDARDSGQAETDNSGKASNGGYTVNASLDKFGTYDSGGNLNQDALKDKNLGSSFKLNLNGRVTNSDEGSNVTLSNPQLTSDNSGQSVLTSNKIGGGTTSVSFNNGNNSNPTSLIVPKQTPAGNYAAPITWTLAPTSNGSQLNSDNSQSGH